ncbi:flagellar hook-length control protein FliK [uncultured Sphingomonas sp.]|uniref:flagellar hook-length control protein FliK n=1 Tax=uncultured Sphingomonas sp. TaxID=158754 RepID=UPI0025DCF22F|nr:flagellar hook-length control protein FliK [uncultured Sphingomonas sp.]
MPSAFAERLVGVSETPVVQSAAPEPATIAARVDTQPAPLTTGLHLTPGASVAQPASAPRVADQPAPAIDSFVEAARPVARVDVPTVPLAATPTSPQRAEVLPAAQMFAQAMFSTPVAPVEDGDTPSDALPVSLFGTAGQTAATGPAPIAVPASAAADRNTLDMSRGEWMMSMIDKIETLRDESGAVGETRLTLSPDALGNVDVSVRRDDSGQYQVRISADTAQARTILADAAPRLNDMAEARGLKLSHAGVETGTGTGANPGFADSNRREAQPSAPTARRPASATTDSGASSDPANQDTRIA